MSDIRKALTARELQTLRNMGNEAEAAADEIEELRAALAQPQAAQPEAVAFVDERAISWLAGKKGSPSAHITTVLSGAKSFERPMPLYATPPTDPAPRVCPECDGPLQWRCPACRIAQSESVAEPAPQAEPSRSQKMREAGFKPRDTRLTCDECGAKFTRQFAPLHECAPQDEPAVTEEMITAYLTANDAYWRRIDGEPTKLGKWRNGTPSEATRVSLEAALASAPHAPVANAHLLDDDILREALGALEYHQDQTRPIYRTMEAIKSIKARIRNRTLYEG